MGLFDGMLKDDESLFMNEIALEYDFMPKILKYRENEQQRIATCIKPLFQKRNGSNIIVHGSPGIGKTVATRKVLEELEEQTDEIIPIFINCWQNNSTYKIVLDICDKLNYKLTMNKNTVELMKIIIGLLNKKSCILVFDEIDKTDDLDFLYTFLEQLYRKTIILITNYKKDVLKIDDRIKSRLTPETLEFRPYNSAEVEGIIRQRADWAFVNGVWDEDAFQLVVAKTLELEDMRKGLYLLKESGNAAEMKASKKITTEHVKTAIEKLESFSAKDLSQLSANEKKILKLIKSNPNTKMGDLFKQLQEKENIDMSYKTFQRTIEKLTKLKLITAKKITGGAEGSTKIINPQEKKLTEF
ncbi:AAA family ATPase [Candidatus Woesearchaeota archaeon]|nr:AAA family ATPase [Candidatus Woesearchaeota archaeon]